MPLDISFDFTTDSPHYWDHFWETDGGLGVGGRDPDSASKNIAEISPDSLEQNPSLWQVYASEMWKRSLLSDLGQFSICERYDYC